MYTGKTDAGETMCKQDLPHCSRSEIHRHHIKQSHKVHKQKILSPLYERLKWNSSVPLLFLRVPPNVYRVNYLCVFLNMENTCDGRLTLCIITGTESFTDAQCIAFVLKIR